jgi:hypothetical protein
VGEKDVELSSAINIFPNPTSGNVTIDATNLAQNVNQINILNVQGQMVFAFNQLGSKAVFDLNLTNLPEGIYVVQLQTSAGVLSKRLILNK